jgi:hypothetical protein
MSGHNRHPATWAAKISTAGSRLRRQLPAAGAQPSDPPLPDRGEEEGAAVGQGWRLTRRSAFRRRYPTEVKNRGPPSGKGGASPAAAARDANSRRPAT